VRSVFNDEKKLSIAVLSQTLPERHLDPTYAADQRAFTDHAEPLARLQTIIDVLVLPPSNIMAQVPWRKR
jgi:hypothetical protein